MISDDFDGSPSIVTTYSNKKLKPKQLIEHIEEDLNYFLSFANTTKPKYIVSYEYGGFDGSKGIGIGAFYCKNLNSNEYDTDCLVLRKDPLQFQKEYGAKVIDVFKFNKDHSEVFVRTTKQHQNQEFLNEAITLLKEQNYEIHLREPIVN